MFHDYMDLTILNISNFNLEKVINVKGIFYNCNSDIIDSTKSLFNKFDINDILKSDEEINVKN